MSRFAPTLVVGLGGSGVGVVRHLKRRVVEHSSSEPVVYLGIDLDENSRIEGIGPGHLDNTEAHYFAPKPIENCIKNLHREVTTPSGPRHEFDTIRRWFTAASDREFRGAQVSAAGARQWRPLGRVGFSLHVRQIVQTITVAASRLDRVRRLSGGVGDTPVVYLIASVAGGTGSGMFHDMAANLRKEMPDFPLMAFFILPEVFAMKPFIDNVFANTYGALQEIAHLKNQHIVFEAEYPEYRPIAASESVVLYQRVYLFGPWVGNLKPFTEPDEAYRYFADLLLLTLSRELRADTLSSQANATGDSGRSLVDPASKNAFSEIAATGIRLLSFGRLAEQVLLAFATDVRAQLDGGDAPRPVLSLFAHKAPADTSLEVWVRDRVDAAEELFGTITLQAAAGARFDERIHGRREWPEVELKRLVREMNDQFGFGSTDVPRNVVEGVKGTDNEVHARLTAEMARHPLRTSYVSELRRVLRALPTEKRPPGIQAVPQLEALATWYSRSRLPWLLAAPTLPTQLPRARADIVARIGSEASKYRQWARSETLNAIRRTIEHTIANEDAEWQSTIRLCEKLLANHSHLSFAASDAVSGEVEDVARQIYLDCGSARPPDDVLEDVLKNASRAEIERFTGAFAGVLREHAQRESEAAPHDAATAESWLQATRDLFVLHLGRLQAWYPRDTKAEQQQPFRLLSPDLFFTPDAIGTAIRKCTTPLFQEGNVPPTTGRTVVRVVVPTSFPGSEKAASALVAICDGEFHSHASRIQRGIIDEDRIIVVVERLFRDAREIDGIDDYAQWHQQRGAPHLFHVDRRWLDQMSPIVSRSSRHGRVACGNAGCNEDIRDVPGQALFCPGCNEPIRNRCGNGDCQIEDLASRPDHAAVVASRRCPSCRRHLRTYWWSCERHGDVAMDKVTCPACVYQGLPTDSRSWRPDQRERFVCPNCASAGHDTPFSATGDVSTWLAQGVDGQEVLYATRKFRELLPDGEHCPQCGTRLVAYCPAGRPGETRHFLYRDPSHGSGAQYHCFAHPDARFNICSVCRFAVADDAATCGRCQTSLRRCRFCTDAFSMLIPQSSGERCPICRTFPDEPEFGSRSREDARDVFCSNLFGCPVGARLHEATLPSGTSVCPLCTSLTLPLLQVQTRSDHLAACAFCSQLFGKPEIPADSWRDGTCCLCGMESRIARQLVSDGATARLATAIADALRRRSRDEAAFTDLYSSLTPAERPSIPEALLAFRNRISRHSILDVVSPRLERLNQQWQRQFGCRGARRVAATPPADGPSSHAFPSAVLDLSFLLSCELDPERWIRFGMDSGVRLEDLPAIQAALETQIDGDDVVTLRRIRNVMAVITARWPTIADS